MTPRSPSAFGVFCIMRAAVRRMTLKVPIRLTWITRSKRSRGSGPCRPMTRSAVAIPAQLTTIWTLPKRSCTCATARATASLLVTSVSTKSPLSPNSAARAWPASALRSQRASFAPAPANNRAVAAPNPDAPPVITATLPASCMRCLLCQNSLQWCCYSRKCNVS